MANDPTDVNPNSRSSEIGERGDRSTPPDPSVPGGRAPAPRGGGPALPTPNHPDDRAPAPRGGGPARPIPNAAGPNGVRATAPRGGQPTPRDRSNWREAARPATGQSHAGQAGPRTATPPNHLLIAALAYARRGWRVFPVQGARADGRCLCGRSDCGSPGKHPLVRDWPRLATTDPAQIAEWWRRFPRANVAIATGRASGLVVLDVDPRHGGDESLAALAESLGGLPVTATVLTGGGGQHLYFAHPGGTVANAVAVGGWAGLDLRGDGGYVVAPPSAHASGRAYAWDRTKRGLAEMPDLTGPNPPAPLPHGGRGERGGGEPPLPAGEGVGGEVCPDREAALRKGVLSVLDASEALEEARRLGASSPGDGIPAGRRNDTLARLAGAMRRQGASKEAIAAALLLHNRQCRPPLPEREVLAIAKSVARYEPAGPNPPTPLPPWGRGEDDEGPTPAGWPEPLDPAAFHGLAGALVRLVEPHTESDPAAILLQFLVYFGNLVGRSAHAKVEATRHFANEFVALVGATSKARKGTSEAHVRAIFAEIEPAWVERRVKAGLSSGEGFIAEVRDPMETSEPVRERGKIVHYERVIASAGASDKRLLAAEGELARVIEMGTREGNTLSATLREAWDTGNLNVITRKDPLQATNAHLSVCGHITREELLRVLKATDAANGFANRFLWVAVRRSKCLPEGGDLASVDFGPFLGRLRSAVAFARTAGLVARDPAAKAVWAHVYPALSAGAPGLFGAVTSRAEAHVLRLSAIYALLDGTAEIGVAHLLAALAVWDYCAASARWIFGERLGDPVAERILAALRERPEGLRREELRDLFDRHKSGAEIDQALSALAAAGFVRSCQIQTRGRPAVLWMVTEVSSLSSLSSQSTRFCTVAKESLAREQPEHNNTRTHEKRRMGQETRRDVGEGGKDGPPISPDAGLRCDESDLSDGRVSAIASSGCDESDLSDESTLRQAVIAAALALAEGRGWPRLAIGPGTAIAPGEEAWRKWADFATEAQARAVGERLRT